MGDWGLRSFDVFLSGCYLVSLLPCGAEEPGTNFTK